MGEDKCSEVYLSDLCRYNLLGGYFEITLKFFLTPSDEYEDVLDVREYVCSYLKEISKVKEIDYSYPQSLNELLQYLIINSNQRFIDFIYNFNGEFVSSNNNLHPYYSIINKNYINSELILDCFNSKYNIYGYKFFIDPFLKVKIVFNELKEFIENNYGDIKKLNLKNRFVESEFDCFISDEIDDLSLNILENIFTDEFKEILDYYKLSDYELTLKKNAYEFCFSNRNYESKNFRKWQIVSVKNLTDEIIFISS